MWSRDNLLFPTSPLVYSLFLHIATLVEFNPHLSIFILTNLFYLLSLFSSLLVLCYFFNLWGKKDIIPSLVLHSLHKKQTYDIMWYIFNTMNLDNILSRFVALGFLRFVYYGRSKVYMVQSKVCFFMVEVVYMVHSPSLSTPSIS